MRVDKRLWAARLTAVGCLGAALSRAAVFVPEDYGVPSGKGPLPFALLTTIGAIALAVGAERALAVVALALGGIACLVKPFVAPLRHSTGNFTATSETHLNYLVPGGLLVLLGLGMALAPARAPAAAQSRRPFGALAVLSALGSALLVLDFVASRGLPLDISASLVPGAGLGVLAVVIFTRGVLAASPPALPLPTPLAFGTTVGAEPPPIPPRDEFMPFSAGASYQGDASFDSLIRAIAEAPPVPTGAPEDLVGTRFGPFQIVELLGEGGMGRVYRTRDERLLRDVAVKVLAPHARDDPRRRERMLREARTAARVNHPNVAAIYDIGVEGDVPFIVMELCAGRSLRDVITDGPLPLGRATTILLQVADALAAAHAHGIVHRDLKPENVIIAPDDRVKVLDFGLARMDAGAIPASDDAGSGGPLRTQAGAILGTPAYMSPEQAEGEEVDVRSDIFAFGTLVCEMLSGRSPFLRSSLGATRDAVVAVDLPAGLLAGIDERARSLATRCLAPDPAGRYPDGAALAADLRARLARAA